MQTAKVQSQPIILFIFSSCFIELHHVVHSTFSYNIYVYIYTRICIATTAHVQGYAFDWFQSFFLFDLEVMEMAFVQ